MHFSGLVNLEVQIWMLLFYSVLPISGVIDFVTIILLIY